MKIVIYGKPSCMVCEKTKMLCQIQSLDYHYLELGKDYEQEALFELVGKPVRALPQIFIQEKEQAESLSYVGGYDALRANLHSLQKAS